MWPTLITKEVRDAKGNVIQAAQPQTINHCFVVLFLKRAAPPLLRDPARKTPTPVITGERREKQAEAEKK
jgi:hypothetical protein